MGPHAVVMASPRTDLREHKRAIPKGRHPFGSSLHALGWLAQSIDRYTPIPPPANPRATKADSSIPSVALEILSRSSNNYPSHPPPPPPPSSRHTTPNTTSPQQHDGRLRHHHGALERASSRGRHHPQERALCEYVRRPRAGASPPPSTALLDLTSRVRSSTSPPAAACGPTSP